MRKGKKKISLFSRTRVKTVKAPKGWRITGAGIGGNGSYAKIIYSQPIMRMSKKDMKRRRGK